MHAYLTRVFVKDRNVFDFAGMFLNKACLEYIVYVHFLSLSLSRSLFLFREFLN